MDSATAYLWSVGHRHGAGRPCEEVLTLHRDGTRTRIVFREGPGRAVAGGYQPGGYVIDEHGNGLNLNQPGNVRALVDEAVRRGLLPGDGDLDGWELLPAAVVSRAAAATPEAPPDCPPGP